MSAPGGMYKHVGQLTNTGKNVVVVFMQLPDDPDHALVIDTDALPDSYNESLRKILESEEGQNSQQLADILGRRMSPDGSQLSMLQKFHDAGRLQRVPVDLVNMVPRRGISWPLRDVLAAMETAKSEQPTEFSDLSPEERAIVAAETKKFNMHASNMENSSGDDQRAQAASLIEMARMLEADAAAKREQAYRMDPGLMPKRYATTQATKNNAEVLETVTKKAKETVAPRRSVTRKAKA